MGDPAFDRWVARQLHKIYDEVLTEDIPEELLRIVDGMGAEGPAAGGDDASGDKASSKDDLSSGATRRR